jgi:hypothetical protein
MEVTYFSKMLVEFQQTTWCYIPEDRNLHSHIQMSFYSEESNVIASNFPVSFSEKVYRPNCLSKCLYKYCNESVLLSTVEGTGWGTGKSRFDSCEG